MVQLCVKFTKNSYKILYNTAAMADRNNKNTKVIGYCRYSDDAKLGQDQSIDSQIEAIISTCKWKDNTTLIAIYVDEGLSGKEMNLKDVLDNKIESDRPGFSEMCKYIQKTASSNYRNKTVYSCYLSRISRDPTDMDIFMKFLERCNCDMNAFDVPISIFSGSASMILSILTQANCQQRLTASINTKNVLRNLSEKNELIKVRYGWEIVKNGSKDGKHSVQIIVPEEQRNLDKIVQIWEESGRKIKSYSIKKIMDGISDEYPYKPDKPEYSISTINNIIYERQLADRKLLNIPVHMKDEKITEKIWEWVEDGSLISSGTTYIAKRIDAEGMYNHKISPPFITQLKKKMGSHLLSEIEKNHKKWVRNINSILDMHTPSSGRVCTYYLNKAGLRTITGKKWGTQSLHQFQKKFRILEEK